MGPLNILGFHSSQSKLLLLSVSPNLHQQTFFYSFGGILLSGSGGKTKRDLIPIWLGKWIWILHLYLFKHLDGSCTDLICIWFDHSIFTKWTLVSNL